MVFSSITFLFYFLPIVLIIYYLIPNKYKNIVLLISSFIFYFYGEPKNIYIMILSILATYIFGILIDKYKKTKYSKIFLILSIFINIGLLIYFKYADFIIKNINLWLSNKIDLIHVILPIGISFYTFQLISYIVDVYRGEAKVQKNIIKLATYISLFPQLIAGPIVRYTTIENQLENREYNMKNFSIGVRRFIIGLGKKVMIANVMGNLINIFLVSDEKSVLFYWLYAIALMIQIYFDFCGYSFMAVGLGKIMGFKLPINFETPYLSTSMTEFFRRWHISLGNWFKNYIYIPLGGNRKGKIRTILNLLVVWILTGLWHGANYNFILWGLFICLIIVIEKLLIKKYLDKYKFFGHLYMLLLIPISWSIFAITDIKQLGIMFSKLFTWSEGLYLLDFVKYAKIYGILIIVGIICATKLPEKLLLSKQNNLLQKLILLTIFCGSIYYLYIGLNNPFLYFSF